MNVRPRRHSGNCDAKCRERNSIAAKEIHQRLTFWSIGVQRNVHRVMMIEPPAIVNRTLAKNCDRQRAAELVLKESLNLSRL